MTVAGTRAAAGVGSLDTFLKADPHSGSVVGNDRKKWKGLKRRG